LERGVFRPFFGQQAGIDAERASRQRFSSGQSDLNAPALRTAALMLQCGIICQ